MYIHIYIYPYFSQDIDADSLLPTLNPPLPRCPSTSLSAPKYQFFLVPPTRLCIFSSLFPCFHLHPSLHLSKIVNKRKLASLSKGRVKTKVKTLVKILFETLFETNPIVKTLVKPCLLQNYP